MDGTKFQSWKFEEILRRSISPANFLARVLAANSQLFVSQQHALRLKPQVEAENPRLPTWHRLETGEATFLIWWFAGLPKSICWFDDNIHDLLGWQSCTRPCQQHSALSQLCKVPSTAVHRAWCAANGHLWPVQNSGLYILGSSMCIIIVIPSEEVLQILEVWSKPSKSSMFWEK